MNIPVAARLGGALVGVSRPVRPGLHRQGVTLSSDVRDSTINAHWTGDEKGGELERLDVRAYEDCLMMTFSAEPIDAWTGRGPVLFGTIASGLVGAIGVRWTPADQDVVLGLADARGLMARHRTP